MARDDDEDWVGTPPEGRHSRDRADPAHWRRQVPVSIAGALIVLVAVAVVLIAAD